MGYNTEFNNALKLKPMQGLDETNLRIGNVYSFTKDGYRIYPVDTPIDLLNQDWEPLARVMIIKTALSEKKTTGNYKVLKIYSENEKKVLVEYWKDYVKFFTE